MGSRSNMKVLRPEQCVVDGKLCAACTEDIEFEQEINKIEKQIKELESRLKRVRIKRRALRTAMNENHDSLIHQFPPEIVSHIFIQCSPPAVCFDKFNENPLYLGAVCQKWRQLAWAMPGLWTSLHVRCPQTGEYDDNLPRLVNEWLKRSADLRLFGEMRWWEVKRTWKVRRFPCDAFAVVACATLAEESMKARKSISSCTLGRRCDGTS